jgi:hypothetical protein
VVYSGEMRHDHCSEHFFAKGKSRTDRGENLMMIYAFQQYTIERHAFIFNIIPLEGMGELPSCDKNCKKPKILFSDRMMIVHGIADVLMHEIYSINFKLIVRN